VVRAEAGRQVGTVGSIRAEPGATNVIAGRAAFPVELRDLDGEKIKRMRGAIQEQFARTDREENVETRCDLLERVEGERADPLFQSVIREAAESMSLETLDLPSSAVQDAQMVARIAPMGMIFVPSRDGISHSPRELTSWEDIANGPRSSTARSCSWMSG